MAINKVEYGGRSLIDLTTDTVTPDTLLEGETAHNKAGEPIVGAAKPGGSVAPFEKVEILEWTPAANTKDYPLVRADAKYCAISDKSANGRPNSSVVSLVMTNAEFFAGFKPITELKTGFQGGLEQTVNYYGKDVRATSITASANFAAGRTYDVILVY